MCGRVRPNKQTLDLKMTQSWTETLLPHAQRLLEAETPDDALGRSQIYVTYIFLLVVIPSWLIMYPLLSDRTERQLDRQHTPPRYALVRKNARWPTPSVAKWQEHPLFQMWASEPVLLRANTVQRIPTGVRIWIPKGYQVMGFHSVLMGPDANPTTAVVFDVLNHENCVDAHGELQMWVQNNLERDVTFDPAVSGPVGLMCVVRIPTFSFVKCAPTGRAYWMRTYALGAKIANLPHEAFRVMTIPIKWASLRVARSARRICSGVHWMRKIVSANR